MKKYYLLITIIIGLLIIFINEYYKEYFFYNFTVYDRSKKYKIPFIVHQTWKSYDSIPDDIKNIIELNKKLCPLFDFKFYNDSDCVNFIRDNFEEKVLNTYYKINKKYSAARADIFRYCVLYILGGIYLDIKSLIKHDLSTVIRPDDDSILLNYSFMKGRSIERLLLPYEHFEQWALIFSPRHPYLLAIIDQIIYEVNNNIIISSKESKKRILHLTGPDAFSRAIYNYKKNNTNPVTNDRIISINSLFIYRINNHVKNLYSNNNQVHYSENNTDEPIIVN